MKIVTFPFWKPLYASTLKASGHAKDMEAFYKLQKDDYDSFREGLLHARSNLMEAFPLSKEGKMVWVDVGGGTARNLEFFPVEIIKKYFSAIYILDISASLLETAQKRCVGCYCVNTTNNQLKTEMKNSLFHSSFNNVLLNLNNNN